MIFWVGILVGGIFAYLAVKIGFYETWAMLFNIVVSIYLAVFLGPVIADIPAADVWFSSVLAMVSIAIGAFLILHCISYTFLTGQFSVSFPTIFNTLGAGFLGFLAGFLVWSFISLLIYITPASENAFVKGVGFDRQSQQTNISYMCWWCNLVNNVAAFQDNKVTSEEAIDGLLEKTAEKLPEETGERAEPSGAGTNISEKAQLGPLRGDGAGGVRAGSYSAVTYRMGPW